MNEYPSFSGLSGLLENRSSMSDWMDKLAESEHNAIKSDLESNYTPTDLGDTHEDAEITPHEQNSTLNRLFSPEHYYNTGGEQLDDSSRVLVVEDARDKITSEIFDLLQDSSLDKLSSAMDFISERFNERIATRFIKSHYNELTEKYADDLGLFTNENNAIDFSKGATNRVNDVKLQAGRLENKERIAYSTPEDVKQYIKDYVCQNGTKGILGNVQSEFTQSLIANTFTSNTEIERYATRVANQATHSFADIDYFSRKSLLKNSNIEEVKAQLAERFGSYRVEEYLKSSNILKDASFVNSRSKDATVERLAHATAHSNLKKEKPEEINYKGIVKQAYRDLANGKSLITIKNEIKDQYGKKAAQTFEEIDMTKMASVEHKLGYFYHDAGIYANCDEMATEMSKGANKPMLLKKKGACDGCKFNAENFCTKASMILTKNPLDISRREGRKIISAANELRLMDKEAVEGYVDQLQANVDNTPVIKSFIARLKEEASPVRKYASKKAEEVNDEFNMVFGHSLTLDQPESFEFLDISLSNLI